MNSAPIVSSLAEQPAYYALYGLYFDYLVNQQRDAEREYFARLREIVTYIQPLVGKEQPYMKSWSLRLFTEREALDRFTPEQASAAWQLVRQVVDQIGPPRGWAEPRHTVRSGRTRSQHRAGPVHTVPQSAPSFRPAEPTSPVDYRRVV